MVRDPELHGPALAGPTLNPPVYGELNIEEAINLFLMKVLLSSGTNIGN